MKSLAVSDQEKVLDLQEFFNTSNVSNKRLIEIKENLIKLLKELVEDKIIYNQLGIILKSGKKKCSVLICTQNKICRIINFLIETC